MIIMQLLRNTDDIVEYEYFIEGNENPGYRGIVFYDKLNSEVGYEEAQEEPKPLNWYWGHALIKLEEFVEKNEFPEKKLVAWY